MKIIELLADIEHKRWSHWQKYLHSRLTNLHGTLVMSPKYRSNLERLIKTKYKDLTEYEKDSDREEVRKFLSNLKKNGYRIVKRIKE